MVMYHRIIIQFIKMAKKNIVDKVTDEDSKIVITNRSVKWIIGILVGSMMGLLGFAYGLYTTLDTKVDAMHDEVNTTMKENKDEIIEKIDDLKTDEVDPNSQKNYKQDLDIVRLYERTNSKSEAINHDVERPEILVERNSSLPTIGQ